MIKKLFVFTIVLLLNFPLMSCADRNYQDVKNFNMNQTSDSCGSYLTKSELCVDLTWIKVPTSKEQGIFDLQFYKKNSPNDVKNPNHEVFVTLWMPSMGHGSSPVTISQVGVGLYRVSSVFFIMNGEWEIHIQLKDGDALIEEVVQKINF